MHIKMGISRGEASNIFWSFLPTPFPQVNSSLTGLVELHTKLVPIALNVSQPLNGVNGTPMREKSQTDMHF